MRGGREGEEVRGRWEGGRGIEEEAGWMVCDQSTCIRGIGSKVIKGAYNSAHTSQSVGTRL